VKSFWFRWNI